MIGLRKYTYTVRCAEKRSWPWKIGEVICTCEANDILEADEILLSQTGVIAAKEPFIGCQFEGVT